MAKELPQILTNVDTFQSWITKTNQVIDVVGTEVLTANSTLGITGTPAAQRNARLFGSFTANTLVADTTFTVGGVTANATHLTIGSRLVANGSVGSTGQILTSNGTGVYWSALPVGSGTVTQVQGGNGLAGNITASGALSVRAQTGLVANATGLYVNTAFIQSLITVSGNASELQGATWAAPAAIGSTTASTGRFTFLNVLNEYRFNGTTVLNVNGIASPGNIEATTPASGTTGGFRLKARADNSVAYLQVTNNAGAVEWNNVAITTSLWNLSADLSIQNGLEVGYRRIPQVPLTGSLPASWVVTASGRHLYKTGDTGIFLTVPAQATQAAAIGTAITIVNDNLSGNITLGREAGVNLQLAGTFNNSDRTIAPGGLCTLMKVQENKWIVSGPGVS